MDRPNFSAETENGVTAYRLVEVCGSIFTITGFHVTSMLIFSFHDVDAYIPTISQYQAFASFLRIRCSMGNDQRPVTN